MRRTILLYAAAALAGAGFAAGQASTPVPAKPASKAPGKAAAGVAKHVAWNPADIQWGDPPPVLPAGARMAVMQGDPSKNGMYTVRLRMPDGYKIAPHWHPTAEHITVISGTFNAGLGDTADPSKGSALSAGGFATMPAKMHHYAWAKGSTEVQVSGMGPFKITYVNRADDPSQKK